MGQAGGWLRTRVFLGALFLLGAFLPACAKDPLITAATKDEESGEVSVGSDADLRLVKQYNSDHFGGKVVRWDRSTVSVYDNAGVRDLQGALNEWNSALNGKLSLVAGGPESEIEIVTDDTIASCGLAHVGYDSKGRMNPGQIKLRSGCNGKAVTMHEIGHMVGFGVHTSDGGVMDPVSFEDRAWITDQVRRTVAKLYDLEPGTRLVD